MQVTSLVFGVAGGALLTAAAMFALRDVSAASPLDAARRPVAVDSVAADPEALLAEIDRLRDLLDEERRRGHRTPVEATAGDGVPGTAEPAADPDRAPAGPLPPDRLRDALLAELRAILEDPDVREHLSENDFMSNFLVEVWTQVGKPERALDMIRNNGLEAELGHWGSYIGSSLQAMDRPQLAAEAFLIALGQSPEDWEVIYGLAEVAPERALALQAQKMAELGLTDADGEYAAQRAFLQLAAGMREDALRTIDTLIAAGTLPDHIWQKLLQEDPSAAEQRVRTMLASADASAAAGSRMRLVDALQRQGRPEDARKELDIVLRDAPDDYAAIQMLAGLDSAAALRHLGERTALQQNPQLWGLYAEQLLSAERSPEAIEAYLEAFRLAPQQGYHQRLLQLAPERVAPQLLRQAEDTQDDELFGDIADSMWQSGRHAEARQYWQRAHEIDRGDGEWTEKLRKINNGEDPFR